MLPEHEAIGWHEQRREDIQAGLVRARQRISRACELAGRSADEVSLVVVTKTFPSSDVAILAELGCRDVGENRDQEARSKAEELQHSVVANTAANLRWHMIGQLQTNKARSVASWADVVESVDRPELAIALDKAARDGAARDGAARDGAARDGAARDGAARDGAAALQVLIQVNLDPSPTPGRGGVIPEQLPQLIEVVQGSSNLLLRGLMGVAPFPGDPLAAFERLYGLWQALRDQIPAADMLSAGMSDDLEAAIAAGATQVRLGSAVLGHRGSVE
jgi:uncharacterized pyridoxal phosphate-containing UPF0001 family protein